MTISTQFGIENYAWKVGIIQNLFGISQFKKRILPIFLKFFLTNKTVLIVPKRVDFSCKQHALW